MKKILKIFLLVFTTNYPLSTGVLEDLGINLDSYLPFHYLLTLNHVDLSRFDQYVRFSGANFSREEQNKHYANYPRACVALAAKGPMPQDVRIWRSEGLIPEHHFALSPIFIPPSVMNETIDIINNNHAKHDGHSFWTWEQLFAFHFVSEALGIPRKTWLPTDAKFWDLPNYLHLYLSRYFDYAGHARGISTTNKLQYRGTDTTTDNVANFEKSTASGVEQVSIYKNSTTALGAESKIAYVTKPTKKDFFVHHSGWPNLNTAEKGKIYHSDIYTWNVSSFNLVNFGKTNAKEKIVQTRQGFNFLTGNWVKLFNNSANLPADSRGQNFWTSDKSRPNPLNPLYQGDTFNEPRASWGYPPPYTDELIRGQTRVFVNNSDLWILGEDFQVYKAPYDGSSISGYYLRHRDAAPLLAANDNKIVLVSMFGQSGTGGIFQKDISSITTRNYNVVSWKGDIFFTRSQEDWGGIKPRYENMKNYTNSKALKYLVSPAVDGSTDIGQGFDIYKTSALNIGSDNSVWAVKDGKLFKHTGTQWLDKTPQELV